MRERELFLEAKAIADAQKRGEFLDSACADQPDLRRQIEALLRADASQSRFLEGSDHPTVLEPIREQPGDCIGPYQLVQVIGEGGFGVVFLAEQLTPVRRQVALKVLRPGMDTRQVIARFEAERQALAIMDHPHIAKVFDAGETHSGRPYFVMERVPGVAITTYCDQQRLPILERLKLFHDLCQAIAHAHSKGIIHRDIKPSNVLVADYDGRAVVKVIDFGVAKALGGQLTERTWHTGLGALVGSLEYMSPEQARLDQLDIDTRSDVYSLGVLLYELLVGLPPLTHQVLRRSGLLESLRMIREHEPLRPSLRLTSIDNAASCAANRHLEPARLTHLLRNDLDWIALKALDKERSRRYQTVSALGEEIHRYISGEPISAHPPSWFYRWQKHLQRNRRQWLIGSLIAALIFVVAATMVINQQNRWRDQQQQAERLRAALSDAVATLQSAQWSAIGQSAPWTAARANAERLRELESLRPVSGTLANDLSSYWLQYRQLESNRRLAEQVENVVIMSATQSDLVSWQRMDQQFRELFLAEQIDPETMAPAEMSEKIRQHDSSAQLCDALELWIGTKGQISALGGSPATATTMQPLADTLLAADADPLRSGIRKLLYAGKPFTSADVDRAVAGADLTQQSPRTLSWLATLYLVAGNPQETDRVFFLALDRYPDDFMLNFDYAYSLESQQRWSEAIGYFLRCTALRPDVAGIWRGLGNAYAAGQTWPRAREALAKATTLAPQHRESKVDLGRVLNHLRETKLAEQNLRQAIALGESSPAVYFELATSLYHQSRLTEALAAIADCEQANRQHPKLAVDVTELKAQCQPERP